MTQINNTEREKSKQHLRQRNRMFFLQILIFVLSIILLLRLGNLTLTNGEEYAVQANNKLLKEVVVTGSRGNILDRNGIPFAVNVSEYVLEIDRQSLPSSKYEINRVLEHMLIILEDCGDIDKFRGELPLNVTDVDGEVNYNYTWEKYEDETTIQRKQYSFYVTLGKPSSFPLKYSDYPDDEYPPVDEYPTAEEMFVYLKDRYGIDQLYSEIMAWRILCMRVAIFENRYMGYEPIPVANDISEKTVACIESELYKLSGVQTKMKETRYYPQGDVASHIIGYVGRITENTIDEYLSHGIDLVESGYNIDTDYVGRRGIELYAEQYLTASTDEKRGVMVAETNVNGQVINIISQTEPENGYDIVLTLDARLQQICENILEEEIAKMNAGEEPYLEEDNHNAPFTERGAIVISDVNSGELLALASYPTFDLNLFVPGITTENYKILQEDTAKPLTAVAFQERYAPGSVFKMFMALSGLTEGAVTINETIYDDYVYDKYSYVSGNGPKCWAAPGRHGDEDVYQSLKHSCDYYYYELADRLGIEKINEWADEFGLLGTTGLEIPEVESSVGNPERKPDDEYYNILYDLNYYLNEAGVLDDLTPEEAADHVKRISQLPYTMKRSELREFLKYEMGYFDVAEGSIEDTEATADKLDDLVDTILYSVLLYKKSWKPLDTVTTGIGQSYVQITPLSINRYVATVANGGIVYESKLMDSIVSSNGEVETIEPVIQNIINFDPAYLDVVREGMHAVVYDSNSSDGGTGTAYATFQDYDFPVEFNGKTGTAQTSRNELQNSAWFVLYAPSDNPEIAVTVLIEEGRSSANAAEVAKVVLNEYYNLQDLEDQRDVLQDYNSMLP